MASKTLGRPSSLNDEVQKKIVDALKDGNYADISARAAGIDPRTYHRWMERGQNDENADEDTPFREFRRQVLEASATAETEAVGLLRKGMGDDWRAVMPWLQARFPDRWRPRDDKKVEISGEVAVGVGVLGGGQQPIQIPGSTRRDAARQLLLAAAEELAAEDPEIPDAEVVDE